MKRIHENSDVGGAYHWREFEMEDMLPLEEIGRILLLGCGDAGETHFLKRRWPRCSIWAFDVVKTQGADFVADAHSLPIQDAQFDLVLSMQVLEHLHSPWIAIREVARVIKPRGWFVGSVAFLKPYHSSYFHMTHKGVESLLDSVGLALSKVSGAQSLTYTFYGTLIPFASRNWRRQMYRRMDSLLSRVRSFIWSVKTGINADEPTNRFDAVDVFSFREYERLRFAPTIVFRARKLIDEPPVNIRE